MTTLRFPAVLALTLALAACSGGGDTGSDAVSEEHAGPERSGPTESSAGLPAGDIRRGEAMAVEPKGGCITCHGVDGNVPVVEGVPAENHPPMLGGQYEDYLSQAMQYYRDGVRNHAIMSGQAQKLTDQQIADLAAYYASRPSKLTDLSHM